MAEREDFVIGNNCVAILEIIAQDLLEEAVEFSFHITEEVAEVSKTLQATFTDNEPRTPSFDHGHGAGLGPTSRAKTCKLRKTLTVNLFAEQVGNSSSIVGV